MYNNIIYNNFVGVEYEFFFTRKARLWMFLLLKIFFKKNLRFWNKLHLHTPSILFPVMIKHVDYHQLLLITCNIDEDVSQDQRIITTSDVFWILGEFFNFNRGHCVNHIFWYSSQHWTLVQESPVTTRGSVTAVTPLPSVYVVPDSPGRTVP